MENAVVLWQVAVHPNRYMKKVNTLPSQKKLETLKKSAFKTAILCFSILFFRALDLYTTHLATTIDFNNQEQNFLVRNFNFTKTEFFISESIFAIFLVFLYLISKKKNISFLMADSLIAFYKANFNISNFISALKKLIIIFFSIIPELYITTSCILAVNNFAVFLYHRNNNFVVKYYKLLDDYHTIDFILFQFPIILLCLLMHLKIKLHYNVLSEQV